MLPIKSVKISTERLSRLHFIDNWSTALIILVVLHHVACTYGPGCWYYREPPLKDPSALLVLTIFVLTNQSWFMGALFLISGYFVPGSLARKGPGVFLKDRILRLGIPLVVSTFVLIPIAHFIGIDQMPASISGVSSSITWQNYPELIGIGPLWFVVILLIFNFGYVAWHAATRNWTSQRETNSAPPGYGAIGIFVLVLALATYLVRVVVPIGKIVLDIPTFGYLPQYFTFFVLGIIASRSNWFRNIPNKAGRVAFILTLAVTVLLFPIATAYGTSRNFLGNGHWHSAVYALWESTFAVGMCLSLITLFRNFLDRPGKLFSFMSQLRYTVYLIHTPVLVFLAVSLKEIELENLLKFSLTAAIGVPLCFSVAYIVRKTPFASRIL
jgi:hypothetical protein